MKDDQLQTDLLHLKLSYFREHHQTLAKEAADLQAAVAQAGRNDLCPCGSGLKTKQCHGRKRVVEAPQSSPLPVYQAQPRARVVAVSE